MFLIITIILILYEKIVCPHPCNISNYKLKVPKEIILHSKTYVYGSHNNTSCAVGATYNWSLIMLAEEDRIIDNAFENGNVTKIMGNVLSVKNADKRIPYFKHTFKIKVVMVPVENYYGPVTIERKFKFITDHNLLLEGIKGGVDKEHIDGNEDSLVNVRLSTDTSLPRVVHTKLKIACIKNCNYDNSHPIVFEVTCKSGHDCNRKSYRWRTVPDVQYTLTKGNTTLTVPENIFEQNTLLNISVYAKNSSAYATANIRVFSATKGMVRNPRDVQYTDYKTIPANSYEHDDIVSIYVRSGKHSFTHNFHFKEEPAEYQIVCEQNCDDPANPFQETILSAECTNNCDFVKFSWEIPDIDADLVNSWTQGDKLVIPSQTFEDNQNAEIILHDGYTTFSVGMNYVEPIPEISIVCLSNCLQTDPLWETELKVICTADYNLCPVMTYTWQFQPLPKNFNLKEKIEYEDSVKSKIKIKENSFHDGDSIEVIVNGRKAVTSMVLDFKEHIPELVIQCIDDCEPAHPDYDTRLHVECEMNCRILAYNWTLSGVPKGFDQYGAIIYSDNKTDITLKANKFKVGQQITLTVTSGKGSASQNVYFVLVPPVIQISCNVTCSSNHDPMDALSLWVDCVKYCSHPLDYTWEIKSPPPTFSMDKNVIIQKNRDSILILPEAFPSGTRVTVEVTSENKTIKTSESLYFLEPEVGMEIVCLDNPDCTNLNSFQPTTVIANCIYNCAHVKSFIWDLQPKPSWPTNITSSPFNKTITIQSGTYKEGLDVTAKLAVRKWNVTKVLHFAEFISKLSLHCYKSCYSANPFEDVLVEVTCLENCDRLDYMWEVQTSKPGFSFYNDIVLAEQNKTLTVTANSFKDGDTIKVTVSNRKAKLEQPVHFVEPIAKLVITCISNCEDDVAIPYYDTTLTVQCVENCYRNNYTWILKPEPAGPSWQSKISYGQNNETITILANSYRDYGSVRLIATQYKAETYIDIYFIEPTPNLSLVCPDCFRPNPDADLSLYALCDDCINNKYLWDITPQLRYFSWNNNIMFGANNESMVIVKNTYKDKENVTVIVQYGKATATIEFTYAYPPRSITIECQENCSPSDPLQEVVLSVSCRYDCGTPFYNWKIWPLPDNFTFASNVTFTPNNEMFTLHESTFYGGQTINVSVYFFSDELLTDYTIISFEDYDPDIELLCIENCNYNPKREVVLQVVCNDHCQQLTYDWELVPKSKFPNSYEAEDNTIRIKPKSYDDKDIVDVYVQVLKSQKNMSITFHMPNFDGNCYIEPDVGVSGQTVFNIDCDEFVNGAEYRLYQNYSYNVKEYGVLVAYSKTKYVEGFLLAETPNSDLTMVVGKNWDTRKEIKLPVQVAPFPATDASFNEVLLGKGEEDIPSLLKKRNYARVFHLASALSTALDAETPISKEHYLHHIISALLSIAPALEPMQLISLVLKIGSSQSIDNMSVSLLMECCRISSDTMFQEKSEFFNNPTCIRSFSGDILWLSSKLLSENSLSKNNYRNSSFQNDFYLPEAIEKRFHRIFAIHLLRTINFLGDIIHKSNITQIESDHITINIKNVLKNEVDNFTKFESKSYVYIPNIVKEIIYSKEVPKTHKLVKYRTNPFWWQDYQNKYKVTTEVLELVIQGVEEIREPISVYLRRLKTPTKKFSGESSEPVVLEHTLAEKSLFTAEFKLIDAPYLVSIGNCMPGSSEFNDELHLIEESKTINVLSNTSQIFVGLSSNSSFSYEYKASAHDCIYWLSSELAWRKELCTVAEILDEVMHCQCQHLSFFGGRSFIPKMKRTASNKDVIPVTKLTKDFTILLAIFLLLVGFFILLYLAHGQDCSYREKCVVQLVQDNVPGDKELYLVLVSTGMSTGAGTTADVALKMYGTLGNSRVYLLSSEPYQKLRRNEEQFFAIYAPRCLGDLKSIQVWHNSRGKQPHWYCEKIIIKHPRSYNEYVFRIERWFSLIYGDGTTKGTFFVDKNKKRKFRFNLKESMRINHHLFSFFTKRPRPGSSKESLFIGFASIATVMLAAILLLRGEKHENRWSFLKVSFLSALLSLPVTIILGWLFRNCQ